MIDKTLSIYDRNIKLHWKNFLGDLNIDKAIEDEEGSNRHRAIVYLFIFLIFVSTNPVNKVSKYNFQKLTNLAWNFFRLCT